MVIILYICIKELGLFNYQFYYIKYSISDIRLILYIKIFCRECLAFSFMCCGCILVYPMIMAIQALAFSEYVIKGLGIEICEPWNFYAQLTIAFSIVCKNFFKNNLSLRIIKLYLFNCFFYPFAFNLKGLSI